MNQRREIHSPAPAASSCKLNQFRRHLSRKWGNMSHLGNIKWEARLCPPGMAHARDPTQPDLDPPWDHRDHSGATLPQESGIGMQKRKVHQKRVEGRVEPPPPPSLRNGRDGEHSQSRPAFHGATDPGSRKVEFMLAGRIQMHQVEQGELIKKSVPSFQIATGSLYYDTSLACNNMI